VGRSPFDASFGHCGSAVAPWVARSTRGRYRYVVIASLDVLRTSVDPNLRAMEWTRSDPAAIRVLRSGKAGPAVFRLDGRRSPTRC